MNDDIALFIKLVEIANYTKAANILNIIPKAVQPQKGDSYEHNAFISIIPRVLKDKDQDFKHKLLTSILEKGKKVADIERYLIVALIEAGVHSDFGCKRMEESWETERPIMQVAYSQDCAYAHAILSRGANPNIARGFRPPVLFDIYTMKLARILVSYGASVDMGFTSYRRDALLDQVAGQEKYEPKLLRYYEDRLGPLADRNNWHPLHEVIGHRENATQKLSILLDLGYDSELPDKFGRTLLDRLKELSDRPQARLLYQPLIDVILVHQAKNAIQHIAVNDLNI